MSRMSVCFLVMLAAVHVLPTGHGRSHALAADEQTVREQMFRLADEDSGAREAAINSLAATRDGRLATFFDDYQLGRIYLWSGKLVFVERMQKDADGNDVAPLADALTREPLSGDKRPIIVPKSELQSMGPTRPERRLVTNAIRQLELFSADRDRRLSAVRKLGDNRSADSLARLKEVLRTEKDNKIRYTARESIALIHLAGNIPDQEPGQRVNAIRELGEMCQALFFSLGGYAMGMYLALHGGPGGIVDKAGWRIPACLYVVYPYSVTESPGDAMVPWFWKLFYWLPSTLFLGLLIPGVFALVIGFFVFRSRVRGVFFAVLTQAITLAAWLVFCMNDMKLCGTNGLTRFESVAGLPVGASSTKLTLYFVTLTALVGVYGLCWYLVKSRLGRVLIAIRDNESRLRFSGYQPYVFKMFVFSLSAMIAALGGMLYAPQMGIVTPTNMAVDKSIQTV